VLIPSTPPHPKTPIQPADVSAGGAPPDSEHTNLLSSYVRESTNRSMAVMSSLRGLGAGISKFFTTTSIMGSRAPSLTPPPSELTTLTTNSMVAPVPPPPGSLLPHAGGASAGGGGGGGSSSSGGASSAGASVPPSPVSSVLGVSPSALATRMRLLRSPVPPQPQGPLTVAPPSQEMTVVAAAGPVPPRRHSGGSDCPVAAAVAAPHHSHFAPAALTVPAPPLMPPAPAGTPHHNYRVAHMRTITEENLDLLLRPGSSGGVDLLGVPITPTTPNGPRIGGAGEGSPDPSASPARKRAELLGSTAEGPDGEEEADNEQGKPLGPVVTGRRGTDDTEQGTSSPTVASSPFASCGALAGLIAQDGVAAPFHSSSGGGSATFMAAAASAPAAAGETQSARVSEAGSGRMPRSSNSCRSLTPSQPGWAGAHSPAVLGPGPVGGAQVGAGDLLASSARYSAAVAPDDLRLALRSPRRRSSAGNSDRVEDGSGDPPADAWGEDEAIAAVVAAAAHGGLEGRRVAYHWWKALPEESLQKAESISGSDLEGYDGWKEQPLLAKPSVRFRKTINADNPAYKPYGPRSNPNECAKVAVNAQHYAILVTDVTQWPYPELQR